MPGWRNIPPGADQPALAEGSMMPACVARVGRFEAKRNPPHASGRLPPIRQVTLRFRPAYFGLNAHRS